jgi:hypothetical protein
MEWHCDSHLIEHSNPGCWSLQHRDRRGPDRPEFEVPLPREGKFNEWTGIHFQTREIRVEPGWTKTHRARVVPLQPNALEWLKLVAAHTAEKRGKVMPSASTWNTRWRRWRQEEDTPLPLSWWVGKDDILRHSYGTYRAAVMLGSSFTYIPGRKPTRSSL